MMELHVGNEALIAPCLERGKIVGDITRQQHIPLSVRSANQVTRVAGAVAGGRQRDDRTLRRRGPAAREIEQRRSVKVEDSRREAAGHRSDQKASRTGFAKATSGLIDDDFLVRRPRALALYWVLVAAPTGTL